MKTRVLVVEGDRGVAGIVQKGLEAEGYAVALLDQPRAEGAAVTSASGAIVLDVTDTDPQGHIADQAGAADGRWSAIVFRSRGDDTGPPSGAEAGAPLAVAELLECIRALLRLERAGGMRRRIRDCDIDLSRRRVLRAGQHVRLKPKEYALLEFLVRRAGTPVTRSEIIEQVWENRIGPRSNIVEVYINALRNKLGRGAVPLIRTLRGVGYILDDDRECREEPAGAPSPAE